MPGPEPIPRAEYAGRVSALGLAPTSALGTRHSALALHTHPVTLFWWLTAGGALVVIGWLKSVNLLLLVGYGLFTLLAVNALSARAAVRRVRGGRIAGLPGYAGRPAEVAVDVFNPTRRPAAVTVTDAAGPHRSAWLFAPLAAGSVHRLASTPTFARRGAYPVGPLRAESGYPFGVVRVSAPLAADDLLRVLPAPGRVDREMLRKWLIRGGGGDGRTRRQVARPTPGTGDVRGVRPYRPGDGLRDVHWRSSARRGSLLVREYDHPDPLDLVVVVDPFLPAIPTAADAARLEWAIGLAMSLGAAWADGTDDVTLTLVVPGRPPSVTAGPADGRTVRATFAPLADLAGTADVPPVPPLPGRGGRAVRLVCSPRPDSPVTAGWRAAGQPVAVAHAGAPPGWYVGADSGQRTADGGQVEPPIASRPRWYA